MRIVIGLHDYHSLTIGQELILLKIKLKSKMPNNSITSSNTFKFKENPFHTEGLTTAQVHNSQLIQSDPPQYFGLFDGCFGGDG
jgi:hypothetical protein